MDNSKLLTKAFLVASLACAIAVAILFNFAGSGLPARLLVDAFLAGLLTSGAAWVFSFRPGSPKALQKASMAAFGVYASTAAAVVLWVLVAKPPFG